MPKRSAVTGMPKAVKEWLDAALVESNFSGYETLSAELKARGCEISKSALHRYGQDFEARLAAIRLATDQARAVVQANPDDDNAVNEALIRLTQEKIFALLVDASDEAKGINLAKIAKAIADLGRASVQQKKYAAEVEKRARDTADTVSKAAKKAGVSADTIEHFRKAIMEIAG